MNIIRLIISILFVFAFVFGFDYLYHGVLLIDIYDDTAFLWRSPDDMVEKLPYMTAMQFGFAILMSVLYAYYTKITNLGHGLRFGFTMGLLLGLTQMFTYTYMPISFLLAWLWFSGTFFQCLSIGAILGFTYKHKEETAS